MTVPLQVSPSSKFQEDLGLDSLDSVEVGARLHKRDNAATCSKGVTSRAKLDVKQTAHVWQGLHLMVWRCSSCTTA